jgi:acetyl-CoA carboxylase biotin carboxyl carrier protein
VLDLAAELLQRLRDASLRELEVRRGGIRVKVSADGAPAPAAESVAAATAHAPAIPDRAATGAAKPTAKTVTAPLTGIFYRAPSPQVTPFVQVGGVVATGDVIGLIEAMKLFNEVRSTVAGRVRSILVESGQLVRAHQPLIELE